MSAISNAIFSPFLFCLYLLSAFSFFSCFYFIYSISFPTSSSSSSLLSYHKQDAQGPKEILIINCFERKKQEPNKKRIFPLNFINFYTHKYNTHDVYAIYIFMFLYSLNKYYYVSFCHFFSFFCALWQRSLFIFAHHFYPFYYFYTFSAPRAKDSIVLFKSKKREQLALTLKYHFFYLVILSFVAANHLYYELHKRCR